MWSWIEPLRAWAMRELWLSTTSDVLIRSFDHRFESGGLAFQNVTIPWNAENLSVEAWIRAGTRTNLQASNFALRLEDGTSHAPESLRPDGERGGWRLTFRLPIPRKSVVVQLFYHQWSLGQISLPVVSVGRFLDDLECLASSVHVRLADRYVACSSFVATQARGVLASITLASRWHLTPLLELGPRLEIYDEQDSLVGEEVPGLSASQFRGKEAVLIASVAIPKKRGTWRLDWRLGKECICSQEIQAISLPRFLAQIKVSNLRFLIESGAGNRRLANQLPSLTNKDRVGPSFAMFSTVAGTAGLARVRVNASVAGNERPRLLSENEHLVTDAPTLVMPGTVGAGDLTEISGFRVGLGRKSLGNLSLAPTPQAEFDVEGSFRPVEGFLWDGRAESELNERLGALLNPGEEEP